MTPLCPNCWARRAYACSTTWICAWWWWRTGRRGPKPNGRSCFKWSTLDWCWRRSGNWPEPDQKEERCWSFDWARTFTNWLKMGINTFWFISWWWWWWWWRWWFVDMNFCMRKDQNQFLYMYSFTYEKKPPLSNPKSPIPNPYYTQHWAALAWLPLIKIKGKRYRIGFGSSHMHMYIYRVNISRDKNMQGKKTWSDFYFYFYFYFFHPPLLSSNGYSKVRCQWEPIPHRGHHGDCIEMNGHGMIPGKGLFSFLHLFGLLVRGPVTSIFFCCFFLKSCHVNICMYDNIYPILYWLRRKEKKMTRSDWLTLQCPFHHGLGRSRSKHQPVQSARGQDDHQGNWIPEMLSKRHDAIWRTSGCCEHHQTDLTSEIGGKDAFLECDKLTHREGSVTDLGIHKALWWWFQYSSSSSYCHYHYNYRFLISFIIWIIIFIDIMVIIICYV